jgi:hypothetical protein
MVYLQIIFVATILVCYVEVHSFRANNLVSLRHGIIQKEPLTVADSYSRINSHQRASTVLFGFGFGRAKAEVIKPQPNIFYKFRNEIVALFYAPLKRKMIFMVHPLLALISFYLVIKFLPTVIATMKTVGSKTATVSKIFSTPVTTDQKKTVDATKRVTKVPTLSASLAMGKSDDVATTSFARNSIDDTRNDIEEETSKMSSDASIAQARRDIELKLAAIVETEERAKLMKGVQVSPVQQTFVSLQGSGLDTDVDDFVIETDFAGDNSAPARVLIAQEKAREVVKQQTILDNLGDALLQKPPKVVADATSATMFAIVVGSPLFQPIVNFFHQHVHLIK